MEEPIGLPLDVKGSSLIMTDFSHGEACPVLRLKLAITIPICELLQALAAFQSSSGSAHQLVCDGIDADVVGGFHDMPGKDAQQSTEGLGSPMRAVPGYLLPRARRPTQGVAKSVRPHRIAEAAIEQQALQPTTRAVVMQEPKAESRALPDEIGSHRHPLLPHQQVPGRRCMLHSVAAYARRQPREGVSLLPHGLLGAKKDELTSEGMRQFSVAVENLMRRHRESRANIAGGLLGNTGDTQQSIGVCGNLVSSVPGSVAVGIRRRRGQASNRVHAVKAIELRERQASPVPALVVMSRQPEAKGSAMSNGDDAAECLCETASYVQTPAGSEATDAAQGALGGLRCATASSKQVGEGSSSPGGKVRAKDDELSGAIESYLSVLLCRPDPSPGGLFSKLAESGAVAAHCTPGAGGNVAAAASSSDLSLQGIRQFYVAVEKGRWKHLFLCDLYGTLPRTQTIIYCNTRFDVEQLAERMTQRGVSVSAMHDDLDQHERDQVLREFHSGLAHVLISTDVRTTSVKEVSLVINYDLPEAMVSYLHRTARSRLAKREGVAINVVTDTDVQKAQDIELYYQTQFEELPKDISTWTLEEMMSCVF